MHTVGGGNIKQEPTATAETLAVLISKGALSQLPCTHHHLATTAQVHLIQTFSTVSFPLYPMPWCPKGELHSHPYQKRSLSCPASCCSGGCTQQDRLSMLEVLAEQPKLGKTIKPYYQTLRNYLSSGKAYYHVIIEIPLPHDCNIFVGATKA